MGRFQLTEHVSYLKDIIPCSDRCHETMGTEGVCVMPEEYISILGPLSFDDGN